MQKKRFRVFLLLCAGVLCVLTSGCVKVNHEMTISADGTTDVSYAIMGMPMLQNDLQIAKNKIGADHVEDIQDDANQLAGFKAVFHAKDIRDMAQRLKVLQKIDGLKYDVQMQDNWFYSRYVLNFSAGPIDNPYGQQMQQRGKRTKGMPEAKSAEEPEFHFQLSLPYVPESSNADEVSDNGKTLRWDLADNFNGGGKNIQVQFRLWHRVHVAFVIGAIIFLLGSATFLFITAKRQIPQNRSRLQMGALLCVLIAVAVLGLAYHQVKQAPVKPSGITDSTTKIPADTKAETSASTSQSERKKVSTLGGSIETDTVTSEASETKVGTVYCPVVKLDDQEVQDKINADIKRAFDELKKPLEQESAVHGSLDFEVKYESDELLSLVLCQDLMNKGAAHGNVMYKTLLYDKKTGACKVLSDFVHMGVEQVLPLAQAKLYGYVGSKDAHYNQSRPSKMTEDFFPDKDGNIWLLFNKYALSDGATGATCIKLTPDLIKQFQ